METNPSGICLNPGGLTGGVTWHKNCSGVVKNNNKKNICAQNIFIITFTLKPMIHFHVWQLRRWFVPVLRPQCSIVGAAVLTF